MVVFDENKEIRKIFPHWTLSITPQICHSLLNWKKEQKIWNKLELIYVFSWKLHWTGSKLWRYDSLVNEFFDVDCKKIKTC